MKMTHGSALAATLFTGAIFGFFYAFQCSVMWGLDAAAPRAALEAMRAINEAVRNLVFFPAFFLTPFLLALAAFLFWREAARQPALWFALAAVIYLLGGLVLTTLVNVPMNEELGALTLPTDEAELRVIWENYSPRWQLFNLIRTIASGAALLCAAIGLLKA